MTMGLDQPEPAKTTEPTIHEGLMKFFRIWTGRYGRDPRNARMMQHPKMRQDASFVCRFWMRIVDEDHGN